ncbi:hypothetical protein ACFLZ7_03870 [Nanoarchaeota archaeon]
MACLSSVENMFSFGRGIAAGTLVGIVDSCTDSKRLTKPGTLRKIGYGAVAEWMVNGGYLMAGHTNVSSDDAGAILGFATGVALGKAVKEGTIKAYHYCGDALLEGLYKISSKNSHLM